MVLKKYLILIVSIQMILLTLFVTLPGFAATEKQLFQKGMTLLKAEEYQQAIDTFTMVIEIRPNAMDAYKNRGVAYMKLKKYDLAVADFLRTLDIKPDAKGIYSNMGVAQYYQKDYAKAIDNYNQELLKFPGSYFSYFNRAICWSELKQFDKSLADVNKALEIVPDLYPAICMKGDLYVKMGQLDKGAQAYEQAIKASPDKTYAKTRLAELRRADSRATGVAQIPPAKKPQEKSVPEVEATPSTPKPAVVVATPPAEATTPVTKTAVAKPVQNKPKSSSISSQTTMDKVYELQSGAYRVENNATVAMTKLKGMGIDARVLVGSNSGKPLYTVRSGNYPTYASAKQAKISFKTQTGITSVVKKSSVNR